MNLAKSFCVGLFVGAVSLAAVGVRAPVSANHLSSCVPALWNEIMKENKDLIEDGNHSQIKVNYPDGGPKSPNGALVKSLFIWLNADNWGEVGWNWHDGEHAEPRRFWTRVDAGRLGGDANGGYGGDRGAFPDYKIDNNYGTHWRAYKDGNLYHTYTFLILDQGRPLANSEVNLHCDDAEAHFRKLSDKEANDSPYGPWKDVKYSGIGWDNPCYHVNILSNTAFDVVHTGGNDANC